MPMTIGIGISLPQGSGVGAVLTTARKFDDTTVMKYDNTTTMRFDT